MQLWALLPPAPLVCSFALQAPGTLPCHTGPGAGSRVRGQLGDIAGSPFSYQSSPRGSPSTCLPDGAQARTCLSTGPPCGLTTTPRPSSVLQHAGLGCQRVEDGEKDGPWAILRPSAPSCVKKPWAVWTGDGGIETEAWPPRKGVEQ